MRRDARTPQFDNGSTPVLFRVGRPGAVRWVNVVRQLNGVRLGGGAARYPAARMICRVPIINLGLPRHDASDTASVLREIATLVR
jgi:hypothetical protein